MRKSWRLHSDLRQIALRGSCSDRSPLYDVRNPASKVSKDLASEVMLSRTSNRRCPDGASCEHTMKKGDWSGFDLSSPSIRKVSGGGRRDRTDDLMLAKHALSQLSYAPVPEDECSTLKNTFCRCDVDASSSFNSKRANMVGLGRLELPTSRLSSARSNQLSYKP